MSSLRIATTAGIISLIWLNLVTAASPSESPHSQAMSVAGELKEFFMVCDSADFRYIYENPYVDTSIGISLFYADSSWSDLALSFQDDSSRYESKKSLKLVFGDKPFLDDARMLNFHADFQDESYIHSVLASIVMQHSGYPAPRAEHVRLYLNDEYLGLYTLTENIDSLFISSRGIESGGNLYRAAVPGACLSIYDEVDVHWELTSGEVLQENDLAELIDSLNSPGSDEYYTYLHAAVDYAGLMDILALNMLLANGSTYYQNYYLYHDIYGTGKWMILPGNLDETLDYWGSDYSYQRSSPDYLPDNPLVERALINADILSDIRNRIVELSQSSFNDLTLYPIIDSLQILLATSVQDDTTDQIPDTTYWKNQLWQVKTFIQDRAAALLDQIDSWPRTFRVDRTPDVFTDQVHLVWHPALDPNGDPVSYTVEYDTSGSFSNPISLSGITDIVYSFASPEVPGDYFWRIKASDGIHSTMGWDSWNTFQVKPGSVLPDTISTEFILTHAAGPYIAEGDVRIEAGGTLRAEAGVEIRMPESAVIHVAGEMEFSGTAVSPIRIRPDLDADCWGALVLSDPSVANLSFLQIERAIGRQDFPAAVIGSNSSISLEQVSFLDCRAGLITSGGEVVLRQCRFPAGNSGEAVNVVEGIGVVEGCEIHAVPGDNDGIDFDGVTSGVISDNLIDGIGDDGIDIGEGCTDILITGNRIYNCTDKGISIGELSDVRVEFNAIARCDTGIAVKDDSYALIARNTLYDNFISIGVYSKFSSFGGGEADVHSTILAASRGSAIYVDGLSSMDVSYSLCDTEQLVGTGNVYTDPQFVDPTAFDFRLQAGSPAIDAGHPDAQLDPDSTRADMGAYSYGQDLSILSQSLIPSNPVLHQNYPNPFNPVSTIRYDLPQASEVTLIVYDILGREVVRLVDGYMERGYHQTHWNGQDADGRQAPSGIYIARLVTVHYSKSIKMVLLK